MSPGRRPRRYRGVVLVAVLPSVLSLLGCTRAVDGEPMPGQVTGLPESVEELGELIVADVPSALPQLPDEELDPPAGAKRIEDIAGYAEDAERERAVLERYGYRFGWERFWGTDNETVLAVFVDQFQARAGAGAYARDLARNDAALYDGVLRENPPGLPGGCQLLTVDDPEPEAGLDGPAALAWCGHGVFSVSVSVVAETVDAAEEEVGALISEQLDLLPPG